MKPPVASVLLLVLACAGTQASKPAAPASDPSVTGDLPIPTDLAAAINRAQSVGRQLYVLDKISAIGTDVLMAQVARPQDHGLRGYLTFQDGTEDGQPKDSFTVSFFTGETPPKVAFQIHVAPDVKPRFEAVTPPRPASPGQQEMIRARQTAISALPEAMQPINPVILPGEKGEVLVYLIAGTTRPGIAVFGKHHRAHVSPDGRQLLKLEPLSKSILELPTAPPPGAKEAGLMITHIVSETPIETHVFVSLLHKLPVYVGTSRGLWRVDGDRIAFIQEGR